MKSMQLLDVRRCPGEDTFVYPDEMISGTPAHSAAHRGIAGARYLRNRRRAAEPQFQEDP